MSHTILNVWPWVAYVVPLSTGQPGKGGAGILVSVVKFEGALGAPKGEPDKVGPVLGRSVLLFGGRIGAVGVIIGRLAEENTEVKL